MNIFTIFIDQQTRFLTNTAEVSNVWTYLHSSIELCTQ